MARFCGCSARGTVAEQTGPISYRVVTQEGEARSYHLDEVCQCPVRSVEGDGQIEARSVEEDGQTEVGLELEREVAERIEVPMAPDVVEKAANGSGVTDEIMDIDERGELAMQKAPGRE